MLILQDPTAVSEFYIDGILLKLGEEIDQYNFERPFEYVLNS